MRFQWEILPFALVKKLFYCQVQVHRFIYFFSDFKDQTILMILNFPAHSGKKGIRTS